MSKKKESPPFLLRAWSGQNFLGIGSYLKYVYDKYLKLLFEDDFY